MLCSLASSQAGAQFNLNKLKKAADTALDVKDVEREPRCVPIHSADDDLAAVTDDGVPVLLCTVPVNLRNWPPFASEHGPGLEPAELAAWTSAFAKGKARESEGDDAAALAEYARAAEIDPDLNASINELYNPTGLVAPYDTSIHYHPRWFLVNGEPLRYRGKVAALVADMKLDDVAIAAPLTKYSVSITDGERISEFVDRVQVMMDGQPRALGELLTYHRELADELHERDRVHTYGSFHIADLAA